MADMDTAIKRRSAMLQLMAFRPISLPGTTASAARAAGLLLYAGITFSAAAAVAYVIQMLTLQRIGD